MQQKPEPAAWLLLYAERVRAAAADYEHMLTLAANCPDCPGLAGALANSLKLSCEHLATVQREYAAIAQAVEAEACNG